jgi:hypothetical protein
MAREKIGTEAFDRAVRAFYRDYRFRRATWSDLDAAFVKASGQRSGPVLEPWLNRAGVAQVAISTAVAERSGSDWDLYVLFVQDTPPYPLDVPIAVRTAGGERKLRVAVTAARDAATITLQDQPLAVALDPDFQLWRALAPGESPPIVREAIAAREPALVVLDKQREFAAAAETLCSALLERPPRRVEALGAEGSVAIVAGTPERVDAALAKYQLGTRPGIGSPRSTAQVWTVRRDHQTVLVISARDPASLAALARALPHLGSQSWAVFEGPRPVARGTWPAETAYVPVRLVGKP